MKTYWTMMGAVALFVLALIAQPAGACVAVYQDYNVNASEEEVEAWAILEDCEMGGQGYYEHYYEAAVDIESQSQNSASDYTITGNYPYGGGSVEAYATLSYDEDPGLFSIELEVEIHCSAIGQLVDVIEYLYASIAPIDINVHTTASLSSTEVDASIFPAASLLLLTDDGSGDVSCPIFFFRKGSIASFSDGDGKIDDFSELEEVWEVSGRAKVVDEINYCLQPPPAGYTIWDCSGAVGMVLTRKPSDQGVLWAHAYGHYKDLWNPLSGGHETATDRLGHAIIAASRKKVTQSECNLMRYY